MENSLCEEDFLLVKPTGEHPSLMGDEQNDPGRFSCSLQHIVLSKAESLEQRAYLPYLEIKPSDNGDGRK